MKTNIRILLLVVVLQSTLRSQDFHYSQFNENPSLMNPALTGASNAMRASLVYKDQWRSVTTPYTSYGFSFEAKIKARNWEQTDPKRSMTFKKSSSRMAAGLSVYNDKAGEGRLGTFQTNLSFAMAFPLSKLSSITFGVQGSFVQRKVDNSKLIYSSQYNGTGYDANLPSGEANSQISKLNGDIGAGLLWSYGQNEKSAAANNQFKALVGFSAYHLTRPSQSFVGGINDRLYMKYVFHGNVLIGIPQTNLAIVPSWLIQFQGPQKEIVAGMMVKYYINEDSKYTGIKKKSAFGLGAYYRNGDALIANALIEMGRVAVGFSYDINLSQLTTVSSARGGVEFMIRFVTPNPFLYQKRSKGMFN